MFQYKAGYKFVGGGVHDRVIDCPAAILRGADLAEARYLLAVARLDIAGMRLGSGEPLPTLDPLASDADMDIEEPVYPHLRANSGVIEEPAGEVAP